MRSLSITGHWNVSLPSGVSPWNNISGPGRRSKYNNIYIYIYIVLLDGNSNLLKLSLQIYFAGEYYYIIILSVTSYDYTCLTWSCKTANVDYSLYVYGKRKKEYIYIYIYMYIYIYIYIRPPFSDKWIYSNITFYIAFLIANEFELLSKNILIKKKQLSNNSKETLHFLPKFFFTDYGLG